MNQRSIKFRAHYDGKMWEVTGLHYSNAGIDEVQIWNGHTQNDENLIQEWVEAEMVKLMQFTDLHDKNGKEIFEGDIVKISSSLPVDFGGGTIKSINYWRGQFYANSNKSEPLNGLSVLANASGDVARCEVIGNIFENPELLGGNG